MKTYTPRASEIRRDWYVVDASGQTLGRLASEIAQVLQGKRKPTFTPHLDTGDYVIVVNATKVAVTGNKPVQKMYYRHTTNPGGLRATTYQEMVRKNPAFIIHSAVRGMLPKGRLGTAMLSKLKVYAGDKHPHEAQQPKVYQITE